MTSSEPPHRQPPGRSAGAKNGALLSLLREVLSQWQDDNAMSHGAALAFYALFSMAPLLVLTIAIAGLALGKSAAHGEIVARIQGTVGPDAARAIEGMIVGASRPSSGIIATVASVLTMVFGASGMFGQLRSTLNQIWRVTPAASGGVRTLLKQRLATFGMILGIGVLLILSLLVSATLVAVRDLLDQQLPVLNALLPRLDPVVSLLMTTVLFAMVYKVLPDARMSWRDVWFGAAVTAGLFTVGKSLIALYLAHAGGTSVYGAAASLVVLLLWVYYSAQILLLGAEFTEVYARRYGARGRNDRAAPQAESAATAAEQPRSGAEMASRGTHLAAWRAQVWRWRRWLIALGVLVAARALLPLLLQKVIASQASQALHARVDVGDVDLALLRGGVALKDVAVRPAGAAPESSPLIAWKEFAVGLRWLPLFHKTIQLREVVLDSPHVALERLRGGELNLQALVPKSGGEAPPEPAPSKPGWAFGIDRIVLRAGNLHFQDFVVAESEPIEVGLPAIEVTGIALRPGLYGEPAHAHVEMRVDEGVLLLDASATMRGDGIGIETRLKADRLPLRRSRVYIPKVGWSDLRGELSADLQHRIDTGGARHDVRGSVSLRDLAVRVPGLEEPALAWKNLTIRIDPVDVVEQRAAVASVDLNGLTVLVRTRSGDPLPLLRTVAAANAPDAGAPAPPSTSAAAAAVPPGKPWQWSLAAAQLSDATVQVLHDAGRLSVGVAAQVHNLAGNGAEPAAVKLSLTIGEGALGVDGTLRLVPVGFAGHVTIDKLNIPDVVMASGVVPPDLLKSARLAVALDVEAGSAAPTPGDVNVRGKISLADAQVTAPAPKGLGVGVRAIDLTFDELHLAGLLAEQPAPNRGDVRLRGTLSLAEPRVTAPEAKDPAVTARTIDLTLDEVTLPGLLARAAPEAAAARALGDIRVRGKLGVSEPRAVAANPKEFSVGAKVIAVGFEEVMVPNPKNARAPASPLRVRLGDVRIAAPSVQITRTAGGIVLPRLAAPSPSPATGQPAPPSPPSAAAAAPGRELSIASFQLTKGRIAFRDRAVKPFYSGLIAPLDINVRELRFPEVSAQQVRLDAAIAPQGRLSATSSAGSSGGTIVLKLNEVALAPFNPYAVAYSPYSITSGDLSVDTKASFTKSGYKADSSVTLHDLDLGGAEGDSLFQQQFGIPLTLALALLKDMSGNITLDVPVEADRKGLKVGIGTIVAGALRSALVGALASPLKLVGTIVHAGKVRGAAPPQIAFRVGRAEPTADSEERIKQLAAFIANRPGMGVTLEPAPSTRDARWLREQALAAELGKPQSLFGAVRNLGKGGTRERIAKALAARAKDATAELTAADGKTLEQWLDERPPPTAEQLRALTDARLAKIETILRDEHGVDASRVARGQALAEPTDDPPVVRLHVQTAKKPQ